LQTFDDETCTFQLPITDSDHLQCPTYKNDTSRDKQSLRAKVNAFSHFPATENFGDHFDD